MTIADLVPAVPSTKFSIFATPSPLVLAVLAILSSYLAGSVPFGLLVGLARGIDVRRVGSGNVGATNVGRALGKPFGLLVFALDFLKGFLPVLLVRLLGFRFYADPFVRHDLPVLCGLAAVLGHTFPLWLRFRGGQGGATGLGVGAALAPPAMLVALSVWIATVLVTRYVSLGTIVASLAYVVAYFAEACWEASPFDREHRALVTFNIVIAAIVVIRHRSNIARLRAGTENKV